MGTEKISRYNGFRDIMKLQCNGNFFSGLFKTFFNEDADLSSFNPTLCSIRQSI